MVVTARQSASLAGRAALADGRTRALARDLAPHVPALHAFRRRRALERSDLYARLRDDIDSVTAGVESARADAAPVPAPGFIRVAAWNLERGRQLDGIARFAADSALLRRVDVLLAPEVDIGMARSGNRDVAAELAASLGMHYVFGNSYLCLDAGNATDWEGGDRPEPNRLGLHGNAIFSRFPIARAENVSLPVTKDKFESSEKRLGHKKALCAELDTPFGSLPVAVVHLDSGASPGQRAQQMKRVVEVLREHGCGERALIGGDFNTTTYDLKSPWRLVRNLARKYARGGFEHALHHYVHPHELYERPLFEELDRAGFDYGPAFNTPATGTTRYDVEDEHARRKVREYMPAFVLDYLRRKLRPFGGVAPVRLDWFAARGLRGLDAGAAADGDGTASVAPTVVHRPALAGTRLSDHDIIVVDVLFDDATGVPSPG